MARRQRPAPARPDERLTSRINAAFDEAVQNPDKKKHKRKMVIHDDEEDEEPVASTSHEPAPGGWVSEPAAGGGFVLDEDGFIEGGGFMPEPGGFMMEEGLAPEGGFVPEGGGFIAEEGSGGFLPDPLAGAGGFLPPEGGFLMDESEDSGFLPELPILPPLPELPPSDIPEPPSRIPLKAIPAALQALDLPSKSKDLLDLFRDVASEDEDGVATVSREKFAEACATLLDGQDDSSDDDEDAYVAEESQPKRTTRRSTRAHPIEDDSVPAAMDLDPDDLPSEESEATDSDIEIVGPASSSKKGKGKATKKGGPVRRKIRDLSKAELLEAEDTFELFFEGGLQVGDTKKKILGLADLERVTRLLKQKMTEEEMTEMLEYAARDGGVVDFEAFARVLAEAL